MCSVLVSERSSEVCVVSPPEPRKWLKLGDRFESENASVTLASATACPQGMKKGYLSIATVPMAPHCLSALPWTSSKPGVASLLFHRTLSPSDALQGHTYAAKATLRKPQPPRVQDYRKSESESEPTHELKHGADTPEPDADTPNHGADTPDPSADTHELRSADASVDSTDSDEVRSADSHDTHIRFLG